MTTTLTVEQHIANVRGCELCSKITYVNIYDICESHWEERIVLAKHEDPDVLSFLCKADPYFQEPQVENELTPIERAHKLIEDVRACPTCIGQGYTTEKEWCDTGDMCEHHWEEWVYLLECEDESVSKIMGNDKRNFNPFYIAPETPKEATMSEELAEHIKSVQACGMCRSPIAQSKYWNADYTTYLCVRHQEMHRRYTGSNFWEAFLDKSAGNYLNPYYSPLMAACRKLAIECCLPLDEVVSAISTFASYATPMSQELQKHIEGVKECGECVHAVRNEGKFPRYDLCEDHYEEMAKHVKERKKIFGDTNPYYKPDRMATPVPSPVKMDFTEGAKIIAREYAEKKRDEELLLQEFRQKREAEKENQVRSTIMECMAYNAMIGISRTFNPGPYRNLVHVKRSPEDTEPKIDVLGRRFKAAWETELVPMQHATKLRMILEGGRVKE